MTMATGGSQRASASSASVVRTVRCSGRVPHRTAATGVSGGSPPGHQPAGDLGPVGHAHEHDDGAAGPGQRLPVDVVVDRVAARGR